ncbi:LLM class flavin-dependent oxidoreductase [Fodinicola acaciae]|uniref:LLM class flavin-dependent oxidoreductase n=1 Tax=Fodinicola acaciae TaxID=2681555 RepID=UPI001C9E45B5|nr:LLM class flavin-dependent oxidoreductase [Fodinicola acaciae]
MQIPFSVLDLAPVGAGRTSAQAVRDTIALSREAERLGYHRYWLAEHHSMPGIASSAPAVLIAAVAAATNEIRVGSGGVMLPNHPPLVVAEQFGTLEALHPGRIDLGLGRAPGTDANTARALRRSADPLSADDFPQQLGELLAFFGGDFPDDHPYARILATPSRGNQPAIWLLGSSGYSAQVAGILGLPFAFAHHFSAQNTLPALALYRQHFRASEVLTEPYALVAASVMAADTDEHARWLAAPLALAIMSLRRGKPITYPTPEEAAAYPYTAEDRAFIDHLTGNYIVGGPETVRAGVDELLAATNANELMVTTNLPTLADRVRSLEIVAAVRDKAAVA